MIALSGISCIYHPLTMLREIDTRLCIYVYCLSFTDYNSGLEQNALVILKGRLMVIQLLNDVWLFDCFRLVCNIPMCVCVSSCLAICLQEGYAPVIFGGNC